MKGTGSSTGKSILLFPPKVEYSLTPFGKSFEPVLNKMLVWGHEYAVSYGDVGYELTLEIEPEYRAEVAEQLKKGHRINSHARYDYTRFFLSSF